jgi:hypothetical protein
VYIFIISSPNIPNIGDILIENNAVILCRIRGESVLKPVCAAAAYRRQVYCCLWVYYTGYELSSTNDFMLWRSYFFNNQNKNKTQRISQYVTPRKRTAYQNFQDAVLTETRYF